MSYFIVIFLPCSVPLPSKGKETDNNVDELLCPVITDWKGWQCGEKCRPGKKLCDFHIYVKANPYAVNYKWTAARREKKRSRAERSTNSEDVQLLEPPFQAI